MDSCLKLDSDEGLGEDGVEGPLVCAGLGSHSGL